MNVRELKKLFGGNRYQAQDSLARRLEQRSWNHNGMKAEYAGIEESRKAGILVHFTVTKSLPDTGCLHYRLKVDAGDAIDCVSGNLDHALQ